MSLVSLKNSMVRKVSKSPSRKGKPNVSAETAYTSDSSSSTDIESQAPTAASKSNPSHRFNARIISDATIGLADGLTVPFALTAGLSALGDVRVVIFGGLAELIAGAISMGLGGYLGAKSEAASYFETRARTEELLLADASSPSSGSPSGSRPEGEGRGYANKAISEILSPFSLQKETVDSLVTELKKTPDALLDLILHHEHGSSAPPSNRAFWSALTIAMGYFFGGLLPLIPYFCVGTEEEGSRLMLGLYISIGVMAFALFIFGYVKTCVVCGWRGGRRVAQGVWGGVQMMIVGGGAAAAAWGLVTAFNKFIH